MNVHIQLPVEKVHILTELPLPPKSLTTAEAMVLGPVNPPPLLGALIASHHSIQSAITAASPFGHHTDVED